MAYNYIDSTGVIIADESNALSEVQQEYRDVFGADLDVTETSPQGKLIAAETRARSGTAQNNASVANQINPNESEGVFLDALWALLGGGRRSAQRSTFDTPPTVTGVSGTVIPAGSVASTAAGDRFITVGAVTIPPSGTTQIGFVSESFGVVPAAINALNTIVTPVLGWETVNNTAAAEPGAEVESDQAARLRRRQTIGLNARTGPAAVIAAVSNVDGFLSLSFRQNIFPTTQVIDGITIPPHSIYVCVDGGTDADIGQALLQKVAGAGFTGAVEVSVVEPASGQTYLTRFDRPDIVDVQIRLTARVPSSVVDPVATIRQSILDYSNGLIGDDDGFVVDADVAPFEIGAAVNMQNPQIFISNVEVADKSDTPSYSTDVLPIATNAKAVVIESDIDVVIV